jgi:hypothetical protein
MGWENTRDSAGATGTVGASWRVAGGDDTCVLVYGKGYSMLQLISRISSPNIAGSKKVAKGARAS